jgi:hypothetical protein
MYSSRLSLYPSDASRMNAADCLHRSEKNRSRVDCGSAFTPGIEAWRGVGAGVNEASTPCHSERAGEVIVPASRLKAQSVPAARCGIHLRLGA